MADERDVKIRVDIETRRGIENLAKLNREIDKFGGQARVSLIQNTKKAERQLKLLGGAAKKSTGFFSKFTKGIALGNIAANAATGAFNLLTRAVSEGFDKMVGSAVKFESTMVSLQGVTIATGRDYDEVLGAMRSQTGGLANDLQIAQGMLKGLTTTLTVDQINNLTGAIKNASIAMGEDFGEQLPLIFKAIKQLNPAILDNIGVTVRLDKINKKIKDGYFGLSKEINETTQQHALFTEVMKQTAIFAGQEEQFLGTLEGKWVRLKTAASNALLGIGQALTGTKSTEEFLDFLTGAVIFWENALTRVNRFISAAATTELRIKETAAEIERLNAILEAGAKKTILGTDYVLGFRVGDKWVSREQLIEKIKATNVDLLDLQVKLQKDSDKVAKAANIASELADKEARERAEKAAEEQLKISTKRTKEAEKFLSSHLNRMKSIRNAHFEASLLGLSEWATDAERIAHEYNQRRIELEKLLQTTNMQIMIAGFENNLVALQEAETRKAEILQSFRDEELLAISELSALIVEENERKTQELIDRWDFVANTIADGFGEVAEAVARDASNFGEAFKTAAERAGRAILVSLVRNGIERIIKGMIIQLAGIKTVTAAMVVETAAVARLTAGYIALAAAKRSAGVGIPGLGIFKVFDDPINDARLVQRTRSAASDVIRERRRVGDFMTRGVGEAIRTTNNLVMNPEPEFERTRVMQSITIYSTAPAQELAESIEDLALRGSTTVVTSEEKVLR